MWVGKSLKKKDCAFQPIRIYFNNSHWKAVNHSTFPRSWETETRLAMAICRGIFSRVTKEKGDVHMQAKCNSTKQIYIKTYNL